MAHFAKIDSNNIVLEVNVVNDAVLDPSDEEVSGIAFLTSWSGGYTNWVQTSFNGTIRKQFARVGFTFDPVNDVFVAPQPFPSWTLDSNHDWQAPVAMPEEGMWIWNEETQSWNELSWA